MAGAADGATGGADLPLRLRVMAPADVPRVWSIESQSSPWPWGEELFASCFRAGYYSLVAERGDALLGFAISSCAVGEAHLLNLAVHPAMRRDGIGGRLLQAVLGHHRRHGAFRVLLEVRVSNAAAIALYGGVGFEEIGRRRDYYRLGDGHEDAVVMELELFQGV